MCPILGHHWCVCSYRIKTGTMPRCSTLAMTTQQEYERGDAGIGATVGRSANRIGGAQIEINGVKYDLEKNDNCNNLHSGCDYYQKRIWNVEKPFRKSDHIPAQQPGRRSGIPGSAGYARDISSG